jgi:hypothetical protein
MKKFLAQEDACFYHITTIENWAKIQQNGFRASSGRIFTVRVMELSVLFAVAIEQLPEIYTSQGIVILKFPQSRNNFLFEEIQPDMQAGVEWTQPYQNIILRESIPIENIDLFLLINFGTGTFRENIMGQIAAIVNAGEVKFQSNHPMHTWALSAAYNI